MLVARALARLRSAVRRRRFVSPPATAELRQAFDRDGFVAGGRLLDRRQVARLRAEFDRLFAARLDPAAGIEHERLEDGQGREYFKLYNLHRLSPAFEEVVRHPRLIAMLRHLTGLDALRVFLDQIQYKPPRTGGWNGWHRDMPSFPLIRPYTALTAWVALDDATESTGCMRMVPGSHRWGDAADVAGDDWGVRGVHALREYHGHPVRIVLRPVRSGHVHFHHELTWHCSSPNRTRAQRRGFVIHFVGAEDRYRTGGRIALAGLAQGDRLDGVAPLVVSTGGG